MHKIHTQERKRRGKMLVANSFDLWQKDTFFSAAEEVQQSADIMESAYRTWLRARREGLIPQHLDELSRELQMALGTAKWQLEEFERAVSMSYRSHGDDITISRHRQFVSAIEDQISIVETALKESFNVDGKKPFRWVHLDEEECDDLTLFLSGTSQRTIDEHVTLGTVQKNNTEEDNNLDSKIQISNQGKILKEVVTSNEDPSCFMEQEENRFPETSDKISYQDDRIACNRKTLSSPNKSALEIVIDMDDRQKNALVEATPKEKGSKPIFWSEERTFAKGGVLSHTHVRMINWINQRLRGHRSQRPQVSTVLPVHSIRFILALMITIFLVVPFLVYSA